MKRSIVATAWWLAIFLSAGWNAAHAGDRLRILYADAQPETQVTLSNLDMRIVERSPDRGTICVAWGVDVVSQFEGETPFRIQFYDDENRVIGRHEEIVHVRKGVTRLSGRKWLSCPDCAAFGLKEPAE